MSTHVPSSSHCRSNSASRSTACGPGIGAHLRQGTDWAGARGCEKRKTAGVEHAIVVEIPKGSRNKYEMDHDSSAIWLDRTLFTAMQYPADYGFFPDTLAEDGDPLDALVLLPEPTFPGCHIMIRAGRGVLDERREGSRRQGAVRARARSPLAQRARPRRRPRAPAARDRALLRLLQDDRAGQGLGDARLGRRRPPPKPPSPTPSRPTPATDDPPVSHSMADRSVNRGTQRMVSHPDARLRQLPLRFLHTRSRVEGRGPMPRTYERADARHVALRAIARRQRGQFTLAQALVGRASVAIGSGSRSQWVRGRKSRRGVPSKFLRPPHEDR